MYIKIFIFTIKRKKKLIIKLTIILYLHFNDKLLLKICHLFAISMELCLFEINLRANPKFVNGSCLVGQLKNYMNGSPAYWLFCINLCVKFKNFKVLILLFFVAKQAEKIKKL